MGKLKRNNIPKEKVFKIIAKENKMPYVEPELRTPLNLLNPKNTHTPKLVSKHSHIDFVKGVRVDTVKNFDNYMLSTPLLTKPSYIAEKHTQYNSGKKKAHINTQKICASTKKEIQ